MRSRTKRFGGRGKAIAAKLAAVLLGSLSLSPATEAFELDEVTIADLQQGMETGKYTARSIVEKYLRRIDEIDRNGPAIRAVLEVNPALPL